MQKSFKRIKNYISLKNKKKCAQSIIITHIYKYKLICVEKQLVTLNKIVSKKIYTISLNY